LDGRLTSVEQKSVFFGTCSLIKQHPVQSYLQNYTTHLIRNLAM